MKSHILIGARSYCYVTHSHHRHVGIRNCSVYVWRLRIT